LIKERIGMNKKTLSAIGLIGFFALTAYLAYKSLAVIEDLEFDDSFGEDIDD
jgi:hypothetical protein